MCQQNRTHGYRLGRFVPYIGTGEEWPVSEPPARVLLIAADPVNMLVARDALIDSGLPENDVITASTLAGGIKAVRAEAPACVLFDLGPDEAAGVAAVRQLVSHPDATPVVVLTGRDESVGLAAMAAGAQDYLVRDDVSPDLLHRSIRYAVERGRAHAGELRLREEALRLAENARLERGLLPRPRLRSTFVSCATYYQPGRDLAVLGGDFFDVVETEDGRVRAMVGDVMGHGPDEAALGVHLRVAWRALVLGGVPDDTILATLSRLLAAEQGSGVPRFVTLCDLAVEPNCLLRLRIAGHPPPLLCTHDNAAYLDVTVGPPLGVESLSDAPGRWPVTTVEVQPGSTLIAYTDGLLDAYRAPDDPASIGTDELLAATTSAVASSAEVTDWLARVLSSAPHHSPDDTAVVSLTVNGRG